MGEQYTLQQLAQAAGMTERNVRAYRTKGLIPPPDRVGRAVRYGAGHLDTLRRVREAHGRGVPLFMIAALLRSGASLPSASAVTLMGAMAQARRPVPATIAAELDRATPGTVERLVELGVFQRSDEGLLTRMVMVDVLERLSSRPVELVGLLDLVLTQTTALMRAVDGSALRLTLAEDDLRDSFILLAVTSTACALEHRLSAP